MTVTIELHPAPVAGDLITILTKESALGGLPLLVEAVQLPYVAVQILAGTHQGARFPLDLRVLSVIRVTSDYVAALRGTPQPQAARDIPVEAPSS